jgi:2-dehydropantoate 2-reductase
MISSFTVVIAGAGALGSALGGTLSLGGAEVWLVTPNAAHREAVRAHGLTLVEPGGDRIARPRAAASCAEIAGSADLIIILAKSADTEAAACDALAVAGGGTAVVSLQNGLGHEEILGRIFGPDRVIGGKTYAGGVMLAPGRVQATVLGKRTIIGEVKPGSSPRVDRLAALLSNRGVPTEVSANMAGTIWDKLLINVATGALSALTRSTYGELQASPELTACGMAAVAEAMAVARAQAVTLSIARPEDAWAIASAGLPDSFRTSMLQTLEKGRRTEIDFINGAVVRLGERLGVATPVNRVLTACVKGIEASASFRSIDIVQGETR